MASTNIPAAPAMTPDDSTFFRQLGTRIAERRKAQDLTQAQLGERVGIAQQQIASFEIGRRRMPISVLPVLAKTLGTSIEALISDTAPKGKRGPAPKLQQQLEQLSHLPKDKQRLVSQLIESVLSQAGR
jgi:transcriptional regulator with XRE-family HTH domain